MTDRGLGMTRKYAPSHTMPLRTNWGNETIFAEAIILAIQPTTMDGFGRGEVEMEGLTCSLEDCKNMECFKEVMADPKSSTFTIDEKQKTFCLISFYCLGPRGTFTDKFEDLSEVWQNRAEAKTNTCVVCTRPLSASPSSCTGCGMGVHHMTCSTNKGENEEKYQCFLCAWLERAIELRGKSDDNQDVAEGDEEFGDEEYRDEEPEANAKDDGESRNKEDGETKDPEDKDKEDGQNKGKEGRCWGVLSKKDQGT